MRFKAILTDQTCMKDFYNILLTFAKISKRAVCSIKSTGMYFSNVGSTVNSVPLLWANIGTDQFFERFVTEGTDEEFDEIWLTVSPEQLSNALNVFKHSVTSIKMSLKKNQFPCLSLEIDVLSANSGTTRLAHNVPVTLLLPQEWPEYQLPILPQFQMSIQLPTLRSLRSLLDKMKNLAPSVTICSSSNGELSFIVETDSAMVVSKYYNLVLEGTNADGTTGANDGQLEEISVLVDSKQLAMCMASIQFSNIRMVGNLLQDEWVHININIRDNVSMHSNIIAVDE